MRNQLTSQRPFNITRDIRCLIYHDGPQVYTIQDDNFICKKILGTDLEFNGEI